MSEPQRGELWLLDFNPTRGREQAGKRPALVISINRFNNSATALIVVLPLTTKDKGIPLHVEIAPPEGNLKTKSFIKCEDIRSVSKARADMRLGSVSPNTMAQVEKCLQSLLGL